MCASTTSRAVTRRSRIAAASSEAELSVSVPMPIALSLRREQLHHRLHETLVAVRRVALRVGQHHPAGFLAQVADRPCRELDIEVRGELVALDRPLHEALDPL